ncbi:hypothetical protein OG786_17080 [Streptomyces sp. NBC_00101]|uniref:hypothetical protein n=1 Tax=Streptomyces sp. NBC_00101 TaxID=2975651 RepID=UPI0032563EC9
MSSAQPADTMTPFDDAYNQPDPRAYFRDLGPWGYQTPHHAQSVFRRLLTALRTGSPEAPAPTVLDICCSYGINAALLNHHLTLSDLYTHYTSERATASSTDELIAWDKEFYASHRRPDAVPVLGLDAAPRAIAYARAVGLLDDGFAENLETGAPSPALLRAARDVRLITVTGGASFLSGHTFTPLLAAAEEPLWVAAFVLRTGGYGPIAGALATHGLTTEKHTAQTYPQRRFTGEQEQRYAIAATLAAGEDPEGKESEGSFHTALYVSRPAEQVKGTPLGALLHP